MKKLNGVSVLSKVAAECTRECIDVKQKLISGIKSFLEENGSVLELNSEFNNVASFKKVMIKNIYVDVVNKSLYVSLGCGKRLKVVNDFNFNVEAEKGSVIESIQLSISELLFIVEEIEKSEDSRKETIKEIRAVMAENNISKEDIFGHASL